MGCALCLFYLAVEQDPKVQLDETLDRCLATLSFVRLLMNVSLKEDRWSWLVYNGTIYLYKMSRYLMTLGYSLQVIWQGDSTRIRDRLTLVRVGRGISCLGCGQHGNVLTLIVDFILAMAIDAVLCSL